jgi:hypothetical protein
MKTRRHPRKRGGQQELNNINIEYSSIPNATYIRSPMKQMKRQTGQRNVQNESNRNTRKVEHFYINRNMATKTNKANKRFSIQNGKAIPANLRTLRNTLHTMNNSQQNNLLTHYSQHGFPTQ